MAAVGDYLDESRQDSEGLRMWLTGYVDVREKHVIADGVLAVMTIGPAPCSKSKIGILTACCPRPSARIDGGAQLVQP